MKVMNFVTREHSVFLVLWSHISLFSEETLLLCFLEMTVITWW